MGDSDKILERKALNRKLFIWRVLAVVMTVALLFFACSKAPNLKAMSYIASISISGEILEDPIREKKLSDIAKDSKIKALIVNINSPGGTSYGGESLYNSIAKIKAKKPVVVVMGTMATSAGYMAALSADHIIARNSTITASIGALFLSMRYGELTKKLGVNFVVLKKGKLKAEPLPFGGPISEEAKKMIDSLLDDQYGMFLDMVLKHRKLSNASIEVIADGRVLTGSQAFKYGLIDQIGATDEALAWLSSRGISVKSLKVIDIPLYDPNNMKKIFYFKDIKSVIKDIIRIFSGISMENIQL
jgi:protease-4